MMNGNMSCGLLSSLRRGGGWVALGLLAVMLFMAFGCYGNFTLTKAVYRFNGNVSDSELAQSIVFWILLILPVYNLAMLGDAIVLNLIDFWSGDSTDVSAVTQEDGTKVVLAPAKDGQEAVLTMSRDGDIVAQARFIKISDREFEVRDANGSPAGKVLKTPSGNLLLTNANGTTIRTIPAESLAGPNI